MAKINILPAKVFNFISAGEVVERPRSVVKELVENAIDAGATEIEIHIEQGGKQLVRVIDNGCGIERDDLQSAFLAHATSKISKPEDLEQVMTLGFRGEALASIAAVSKTTIISKTKEDKCYSLTCSGGALGQIKEASGKNGTEVCVETLFYNTPARLKFLKNDKQEEAEITTYVSRFILSHSEISFTYYANGKKILQSFGGGEEEAFVNVYGAAVLRECFHIDAEINGVRIHGYIGNQNFFKANKSYQTVFLNGRYVVNATISAAIASAYSSYVMKRQYPFCVLYIHLPPEVVDVNVHPNKTDVRFVDNNVLFGAIYKVLTNVLDGKKQALEYVVQDELLPPSAPQSTEKREETPIDEPKTNFSSGFATLTYEEAQKEIERCAPSFTVKKMNMELPFGEVKQRPKGFIPAQQIGPYISDKPDIDPLRGAEKSGAEKLHEKFPDLFYAKSDCTVRSKDDSPVDYFEENKKYLEELDRRAKQDSIEISECTYAGRVFNTYLFFENKKELYIVDQHAAHERLIFDKLIEKMEKRAIVQQPMLVPYVIKLNAFECAFIREQAPHLAEMGFEVSEGENDTCRITAIPADLQDIDLNSFIHDILSEINTYRSIKLTEILRDKLASAACRAAVKGGMELTRKEIDELFKMINGNLGLKCPHGRPVVVKMTKMALEKLFKRIV